MTPEEFPRPASEPAPLSRVIHRRWVLSKRPDDGRPLLIREDRVLHPGGFVPRPRRAPSAETERAGGAPALI